MLLQSDYDEADVSSAALRIVEDRMLNVCGTALEDVCPLCMTGAEDGLVGMLLGFSEKDRDEVRARLRKSLHQLCAYMEMYEGFDFTMAIGPLFSGTDHLQEACAETRTILRERLICGTGRILDTLPLPSAWHIGGSLEPLRHALNGLPMEGADREIVRELEKLEQEVGSRKDLRGEDVYDLAISAAGMLLRHPQIADGDEKLRRFTRQAAHTGQMKKLFAMLRTTAQEEARLAVEQQRSADARPIRQAQDYVRKHFAEPITLERVCEEVGFSVSYFSALYKKETGENFQHFVTRVRIDRARELLAQTGLPVSEICGLVGYSDIKYFTQTFKKETELSPAQYRKLYG